MRLHPTLPAPVLEAIRDRRWADLADENRIWPDADVVAPDLADLLTELPPHDRALLFRAVPSEVAGRTFAHLPATDQDALLTVLTDDETRHLLDRMAPDDRTLLLHELPGQVTQRLLNLLPEQGLEHARGLLGYPDESVGRLMTPHYVAVRQEWTVDEALANLREHGHASETLDVVYVVDPEWRLIDGLSLRRLVLADPDATVASLMDRVHVSIDAHEDREHAVRLMQRYDRTALPVTGRDGVLVGIVTIDDAFDVATAEATEDFHLGAAVQPLRRGYLQTPLFQLYRSRIVWLAGLVLVNLASSGVIAAFEEVLLSSVALAFFIPLIIDTGGNAGAQSATLLIRAISTGNVRARAWARVFARELAMGAALGVTLGAMGFGLGLFRGGAQIGLVVFLTIATMLILTNLLGSVLPFVLQRLGRDPATASGPLITSVADVVGLLLYFGYATLLLSGPSAPA
ncbi:MAG: magnesium transporter [Trueperaceae bacterium]